MTKVRLTPALEEDHDVRCATADLFEVQWDDIAVELESLSDGCIHLTAAQISSVLCDPDHIVTLLASHSPPSFGLCA